MSNEKPLLNDQAIFPTDEVLKEVLGESYATYEDLLTILNEQGLVLNWNYYKDGKAWLSFNISGSEQLSDLLKVVEFKKKSK